MAQTVAEVARRLNRRNGQRDNFPALLLMTDTKRLPDPRHYIPLLPTGSALVVRHTNTTEKEKLALKIKPLCRKHKVKLLLSNDVKAAIKLGLDGVHFSEKEARRQGKKSKTAAQKNFIFTSACHSLWALKKAERANMDAVLISPIFATRSHPDSKGLGVLRFQCWTTQTHLKCYALGGITPKTAQRLSNSKACGFAGISGLI
ncbi:MAG: thiamine phosphate synthase [Methylocystaceae bacterium]|nr:thiamine phosphate synthase [Methylocystaceae bacterium]